MNTCETCKHWGSGTQGPYKIIRPGYKYCFSEKLVEDDHDVPIVVPDDLLIYDYSESGGFHTGPSFGCVHWIQK